MIDNQNLIVLSVIVGNEESVIERFIRSFSKVADNMVFVRAIGSQEPDKTKEIIQRVCPELGVRFSFAHHFNKNTLNDLPHVDDFGGARQKAWEIAAALNPKYIMWADCDDIIAPESAIKIRDVAEQGEKDVFIIPYHVKGDKQVVMRERVVRNTASGKLNMSTMTEDRGGLARWRYPIHEQLEFLQAVAYTIVDAPIIHSPLETKSGSHERNLALLNIATRDAARNFFYLHQEHFQACNTKLAKSYGQQAIASPDLEPLERYEVLLNLAQLEDGQDAKCYAVKAFEVMPDRREALALLASYAIIDSNYEKALQFARLMIGIPKPKRSYWSLNNDWYGWKGAELYIQCLRLAGEDWTEAESLLREGRQPMFSILHATLGRPGKALMIREQWLSKADNPRAVEYIFGLHEGDESSLKALKGFPHTICAQGVGCPTNYDTAAGISRGKIIIQAQDDCYPPQGWDTELLKAIGNPDEPAFVAVSDGQRTDRLCVNTIITRSYMNQKATREVSDFGNVSFANGFMHRGYPAVFADTENTYQAYKHARDGHCKLVEARHIVIFHDHPHFNPAIPWDSTYASENSSEGYRIGNQVFLERNPEAATDGILTL